MKSFKIFLEDKEPTRLITKPEREFHKKLSNDIRTKAQELMQKAEEYKGWKLEVRDRIKSKRTNKTYEITARGWNSVYDVPMYLTKTIGEDESGTMYANKHSKMKYGTGVHELLDTGEMIKLGKLKSLK